MTKEELVKKLAEIERETKEAIEGFKEQFPNSDAIEQLKKTCVQINQWQRNVFEEVEIEKLEKQAGGGFVKRAKSKSPEINR